jgi:outer membrane receptor protein involved in Fe transport
MDSRPKRSYGLSRIDFPARAYLGVFGVQCTTVFWAYLLAAAALPVVAVATPKLQEFHIDVGDATLTLNEFSRQSSLQLLFDYNIVRGRRTRAITGEFDPPAALRQMLIDTGLEFDFVNDRTLAVTLVAHEESGSAAASLPPAGSSQHAQGPEGQTVKHEGPGTADPATDSRVPELEVVRITGTHVHGADPVGEHVICLGREAIADSGAATLPDFLRTLPQTFGGGPTEDTHFGAEASTNSGLGSGINLRGLGARATLVLINGRRLAPGGSNASFVDVESIPIAAVERVDILPDSASALYGADAVGGVVNFVMRDSYQGAESVARVGSLGETRVSQTLGQHWDSGNALLTLEFYKRDALPSSARAYATSNLLPLGGQNFNSNLSNPGNIVTATGQIYAIPAGQSGTNLVPADFSAGAPNLQDKYLGTDLVPNSKRWSLYGSGKEELSGGAASLFANVLVSHREAMRDDGSYGAGLPVTSANPFYVNPIGTRQPILVYYSFLKDLGPLTVDALDNTSNITLGADFDAGAQWRLSAYVNYARERENQFEGGEVDIAALYAALADPNPATAFNPFGDGSHTNPGTIKAISAGSRFDVASIVQSGDVTADGPIAQLPGGSIELAVGADRRKQLFTTLTSASLIAPKTRTDLNRWVTAVFSELTVPLFGKGNGGPGYRRLELSVAGRFESYSDFGHATTPKYGVAWSPADVISVRGTWGRAIRAPTLSDLDRSQNFIIPVTLADSSSPTGTTPALVLSGNSANLTAEMAKSWTAGLDINPERLLPGLSVSVTYFNILFRDRIEAPAFAINILDNPGYANLVTRSPSAALIQASCTGSVYVLGTTDACTQYGAGAILDMRVQNTASVKAQGIDFSADYKRTLPYGTLKLTLDGTYLLQFTQQDGPNLPATVLLNTENNPIDLKLRGTLSWQQRRFGGSLAINFQDHYRDTGSEPHRNIRSLTTIDAQVRYDIAPYPTGLLQNTRVELNAINLFNVDPPFLNNQLAGIGYDQENADPFGRMLSLQIRKSW